MKGRARGRRSRLRHGEGELGKRRDARMGAACSAKTAVARLETRIREMGGQT
jgi:hypothetical protein